MTRAQDNVQPKATPSGELGGGGRFRRLMEGWSAALVQIFLGLVQQLLLIPVFLHVWTAEVLAAWLAIYAAGSLTIIADAGLQLRAINRFLAFRACRDCDGRTANFYAALLRIYIVVDLGLCVLVVAGTRFLPPSGILGFGGTPSFDTALLVMIVGMLLTLPANLVSALYRARGKYSRTVWLQNCALLLGQIAQLIALGVTGSLVAVAAAFVSTQVLLAIYLVAYDAPRLFPVLRMGRGGRNWRWVLGQFSRAFPFAVANLSELALVNAPVLMVSALVADRVAVAQWGLTRVIASFLRGLCWQVTLPIAAELGHDYAVGDRERLRHLYARGSTLITVIASLIVAGLLPFWPDFFGLWTHGSIPYDAALAHTLLLGSVAMAPSLLALSLANHSNRGDLLVRTKGLQLIVFLILSVVLIRWLGPLGAALALVASDLLVQFGLLGFVVMGTTLRHPMRHTLFVAAVASTIVLLGWAIGAVIVPLAPAAGLVHFVAEAAIWLVVVGILASPLLNKRLRNSLIACIPA